MPSRFSGATSMATRPSGPTGAELAQPSSSEAAPATTERRWSAVMRRDFREMSEVPSRSRGPAPGGECTWLHRTAKSPKTRTLPARRNARGCVHWIFSR
ncbi:MAG: hypothetical protein CVU56_07090 [Deltaproteobacteria bacterium HGW-Deltaproteobacteria-14]|nr:MAG: hypothetical protein CVU56_07090 [Deltaproteobacteria bacterium HGW-Deltaproteobacteria-14]